MENRVLVLTTTFPPDTRGRAVRLKTRLKYMIRNHNWSPVILVGQEANHRDILEIEGKSVPIYRNPQNQSRISEENDDNENETTTAEDLHFKISDRIETIVSSLKSQIAPLLFPDHYITHLPQMIRSVDHIIQQEDIDTLYTMCFPFTFHLVGLAVSRKTDVGWLAEFRDPWVTNPNHFQGEANIFHKFLERKTVERCDQLVYNYGIQVPENYFEESYPEHKNKVTLLDCPGSCGFDFERLSDDIQKHDTFTIVYGGSFYGDGHSPEVFLQGLSAFCDKNNLDSDDISVEFYGDWNNSYDTIVETYRLGDIVTPYGWVPFETFFSRLRRAHISLFIVRPFSGDERNIPQKVVDYIAADVPMIVLADEGWEVSKYTHKHGIGVVANPDNPVDIQNKIAELHEIYKEERLDEHTANSELLKQIDAQTQTLKFVGALNKTVR